MNCQVLVSEGDNNDNDDEKGGLEILRLKRWKPQNHSSSLDESEDSEDSDRIEAMMETKKVIIKSLMGSCAQLISVNVELMDPSNTYGALKSAAITVQGPVTEVEHDTIHSASRREWHDCVRWGDIQVDVTFDDPNEPRNKLAILLTHMRRGRMQSLGGGHKNPGPTVRGPEPLVSGLVLFFFQKGSDGEPDVYKRVGTFREQHFGNVSPFNRFGQKRQPDFRRPEDRIITLV